MNLQINGVLMLLIVLIITHLHLFLEIQSLKFNFLKVRSGLILICKHSN